MVKREGRMKRTI